MPSSISAQREHTHACGTKEIRIDPISNNPLCSPHPHRRKDMRGNFFGDSCVTGEIYGKLRERFRILRVELCKRRFVTCTNAFN